MRLSPPSLRSPYTSLPQPNHRCRQIYSLKHLQRRAQAPRPRRRTPHLAPTLRTPSPRKMLQRFHSSVVRFQSPLRILNIWGYSRSADNKQGNHLLPFFSLFLGSNTPITQTTSFEGKIIFCTVFAVVMQSRSSSLAGSFCA